MYAMEIEDRHEENPDDTKHWIWGIFYYNPDDKRIFPPQRIRGIGWTINFANPYSIIAMVALIALMILLVRYLH